MDGDKKRFCLNIAYDGRPFEGWQSQPGGNTVQDHIEKVLQKICPASSSVHGSGRTDAGVSAEGQVAHFDVPDDWKMTAPEWQRALNAQLPPTIRIVKSEPAAPDFHARFSAKSKIYRYRIFTGEVLPPLDHGLTWHTRQLRRIDLRLRFTGTGFFIRWFDFSSAPGPISPPGKSILKKLPSCWPILLLPKKLPTVLRLMDCP